MTIMPKYWGVLQSNKAKHLHPSRWSRDLLHRHSSWFAESFDILCRWWDLQFFRNCFTVLRRSFSQAGEPLPTFTFQVLPLWNAPVISSHVTDLLLINPNKFSNVPSFLFHLCQLLYFSSPVPGFLRCLAAISLNILVKVIAWLWILYIIIWYFNTFYDIYIIWMNMNTFTKTFSQSYSIFH